MDDGGPCFGQLTRIVEDRRNALSQSAMDAARYAAGAEFYLATGDIYATRQLLDHADVGTTAMSTSKARPPTSRTSCGRSGAPFRSEPCSANYSDRE